MRLCNGAAAKCQLFLANFERGSINTRWQTRDHTIYTEGICMLIFTNRTIADGTTAAAFARAFTPGNQRLGVANVKASGQGWKLSDIDKEVTDQDSLDLLLPLFQGEKPVLLYVHGNNNPPATCFGRMRDLEALYPDAAIIGFSWPSEGFQSDGAPLPNLTAPATTNVDETELSKINVGNRAKGGIQDKIRRFHQAQTNAKDSVEAFARLLRLIAAARLQANRQPFSLAIHSLGAHLFQYSLPASGATEAVGAAYNVALLAPCVRAAAHKEWLERFRPKGRTYITYNKGDSVLFGASIADGEQVKLGADPGTDLVRSSGVRYISFTDAATNFGGHGYFVKNVNGKAKLLFSRIFYSQADYQHDESPKVVYPLDCDPSGTVCYMAVLKKPAEER